MKAMYDVQVKKDVPIKMRDGVMLYADIYIPHGHEKFPALIMRSPYDKTDSEFISYLHPEWFARQGYIIVTQDVRGKFASDGVFQPYHHERTDGVDTISFVRQLPECNGKVGMYGFSYVGATQLQAVAEDGSNVTAIVPAFTNDGYYEDWSYKNGALHQAFLQSWAIQLAGEQAARSGDTDDFALMLRALNTIDDEYDHLPLTDHPLVSKKYASYYYEWLNHPVFDEYWRKWYLGGTDVTVPALHVGGWYDVFLEGTLRNFTRMTRASATVGEKVTQKLMVGPWYHMPWSSMVGDLDFGVSAGNIVNEIQTRWFDYWLKGESNGITDEPPVSIFVMGENKWRQEFEWPLARTHYTKFYLHSDGGANSLGGTGFLNTLLPNAEMPDIYVYNPLNPVPSVGGHSCCIAEIAPMGPKDQRYVELRNDVLVYTSDALSEDVEVTGPIQVVLYASSTANDTDFTVKLVDVYPDGRAINIVEGIQRASFRESNENPSPIEPGRIYEYTFHVGSTSNLFKTGHRIRIEVSSSNFPVFDRNLNIFKIARNGTYSDVKNATQKIYHSANYPSHVVLPIIPR